MTPELQHALVYLFGALALAVPATVNGLPRLLAALEQWTKSRADAAKASLVVATSHADEMSALRRSVEDCEHRCEQRDETIEMQRREIATLNNRCDQLHRDVLELRDVIDTGRT